MACHALRNVSNKYYICAEENKNNETMATLTPNQMAIKRKEKKWNKCAHNLIMIIVLRWNCWMWRVNNIKQIRFVCCLGKLYASLNFGNCAVDTFALLCISNQMLCWHLSVQALGHGKRDGSIVFCRILLWIPSFKKQRLQLIR